MSGSAALHDQATASDAVLNELIEQYAKRLEKGEALDVDQCAAEHPDFAEQLRKLLPTMHSADYGKIVAVGYAITVGDKPTDITVLARYNADGTPDTTFGNSGQVITPGGSAATGVAIQANGQIVVAAGDCLQRYNTDGTLDSTFGNGGFVTTTASAVAIQSDGRIVTANPLSRYLASEPEIGSFTANPNPVPAGTSTALTATNIVDGNPNSSISQVAIYLDVNATNTLQGYATQSSAGVWTFTFSTSGLTSGNSYTLYAQAQDSFGVLGDLMGLTLQVQ